MFKEKIIKEFDTKVLKPGVKLIDKNGRIYEIIESFSDKIYFKGFNSEVVFRDFQNYKFRIYRPVLKIKGNISGCHSSFQEGLQITINVNEGSENLNLNEFDEDLEIIILSNKYRKR